MADFRIRKIQRQIIAPIVSARTDGFAIFSQPHDDGCGSKEIVALTGSVVPIGDSNK